MIKVTLIPILSDNYAYLLEGMNGETAIVDPGEAAPIIKALGAKNIKPDMILITHHHWDHMDGVPDMLAWHQCPLIGSDCNKSAEDSPAKTRVRVPFQRILSEGDDFDFGGESVKILDIPGHTPEHIGFYFEQSGFTLTGDALFAMGCGRILDGTTEELFETLQKLAALPPETKIYCGHEYTLSNAKFCTHVAPENDAITTKLGKVQNLRDQGQPTIPSTIGEELETNIFLQAKNAAEFAALRKAKDQF